MIKYTKELLEDIVKESTSIADILRRLGLKAQGSNYRTIKKKISKFQLDISHFTGQSWSKGKKVGPKKDISLYLENKIPVKSYTLKRRLLQEGYLRYRCDKCKNITWQGQQIPLELHHIDGNHSNNNLSNLKLLCPNCHTLTPNYRNKRNNTRVVERHTQEV